VPGSSSPSWHSRGRKVVGVTFRCSRAVKWMSVKNDRGQLNGFQVSVDELKISSLA
jgi:hypothetical protein